MQELSSYFTGQKDRLQNALLHFIEVKKQRLERLTSAYAFTCFSDTLSDHKQYIAGLMKNAEQAFMRIADTKRHLLESKMAKLDALSPLKTLSRGYSIALTKEGKLISHAADAVPGTEFTLKLSDGEADCIVQ